VGGWINVYQQVRGIATLVDFYLTVYVLSGKTVLGTPLAATTPDASP